jgi:hypothetical protein
VWPPRSAAPSTTRSWSAGPSRDRRLKLSSGQIERLNNLTTAVGERHDEGNMAVIDR